MKLDGSSNWVPSASVKVRLAVVIITIAVTTADGIEVQHETWAVGPTVKEANASWNRQYPEMASRVIERRIVTSGVPPVRVPTEREIVGSREMERRRR